MKVENGVHSVLNYYFDPKTSPLGVYRGRDRWTPFTNFTVHPVHEVSTVSTQLGQFCPTRRVNFDHLGGKPPSPRPLRWCPAGGAIFCKGYSTYSPQPSKNPSKRHLPCDLRPSSALARPAPGRVAPSLQSAVVGSAAMRRG